MARAAHDRAIADFTAAVRLKPGRAETYASRAASRAAIGQRRRALADCRRALARSPDQTTRSKAEDLHYRLKRPGAEVTELKRFVWWAAMGAILGVLLTAACWILDQWGASGASP
jgi:tetratricopeptide (TPR) repeat protein